MACEDCGSPTPFDTCHECEVVRQRNVRPAADSPCEFCGSWGDVHEIWCIDVDTETSQQETP